MLAKVIEFSLAHRFIVLVGTALVAVIGAVSLWRLPIDAFPDTTPVQVQVNTVAQALVPEEVERQLTMPIEQVLSGLPHLTELRSISKFGLSQVTLQFADGTDLWFARQLVAERLSQARIPDDVERPTLGPVATGLGEVFHYLVRGRGKTLEQLRTAHDGIIAPQLRAVPGVAEVNAWGGEEKQWHVTVDPLLLRQFDLALGDVVTALRDNNANVGGGIAGAAGAARLVLGVGVLTSDADIRDVVIDARNSVPVRVRDVARVSVGHEIRRGAVTADGEGEVVLGLGFMLVGENSHRVTSALAARVKDIETALPPGIEIDVVYQRTTLVDQVLSTVKLNLLEGALLVIAVLFLFLGGRLRAGLMVALVIPLSMLVAATGMLQIGIAGTVMSLGAIDFGLIIDSSVILLENAERRVAIEGRRRPVFTVVRDAAVEVSGPMLFGGLIIMVVYLPILTLEGVEGRLFRPMAITVMLALVASMVFSLTLMPVLASLLLRPGASDVYQEPRLPALLKRLYRPVLELALSWPRVILAGAVVIVLTGGGLALLLGSEFVPKLSEGSVVVNTVRLAEVSLAESVRYGSRIEQVLLARFPDEIERVWTRTGTAEVATDPMGIELSDVFVTLKPRGQWRRAKTQDQLVSEMQAELADMPGMRLSFLQPIQMRVNEMIAGVRGDVAIKVFGDDLDMLKAKAREIEAVLREVPGATDISVDQITGQPVVQLRIDRAAIARYGIHAKEVLDVVKALGGHQVGDVLEGERRFPLAVVLPQRLRDDPHALSEMLIPAPGGERVPFDRLVDIKETIGPTTIEREWGKRRIVVQANVRARDLGGFVDELRHSIADKVSLPPGYFVRYGGQFENLQRARARLLLVVPLVLGLIFGLLYFAYRSVIDAMRVFTGVPFALVGGVLALLVRDLPFSISAAVGFIALFGVSVLDDMVLVSRIRQLLDSGIERGQAIRQAALSRLRPVLMTSTVASLGFVPMALNTGVGAEVQRPLATVVIGGMMSATLLTLVVLPVLYSVIGARARATSQTIVPEREGS